MPISLLKNVFLCTSLSSGIGTPVASISLISATKLFYTLVLSRTDYFIFIADAST